MREHLAMTWTGFKIILVFCLIVAILVVPGVVMVRGDLWLKVLGTIIYTLEVSWVIGVTMETGGGNDFPYPH